MKSIAIMLFIISVSSKHVPISKNTPIHKRDVFDIIPDIAKIFVEGEDDTECTCENDSDCIIAGAVPCTNIPQQRENLLPRRQQLRKLFVKWLNRSKDREI